MKEREHKILVLSLFLACFYAVWTGWALLLVQHPTFDESGIVRATVRIFVWVVPVFIFVLLSEGRPVLICLGLSGRAGRGLGTGVAGFGVLLLLMAWLHRSSAFLFKPPTDVATWLNPILTAPLAEELMFRGLVFRVLRDRFGLWVALPISSLLFALIHLPYWYMSGHQTPALLLLKLASMTGYGFLFATLYQWSGSLWSPLICHWLNNFVNLSVQAL